jgi:hypothetical protein
MLKRFLAVVAGTLVGMAVIAADAELKADHPDRYVVQKGDTLWDIAGRFLTRPWLWPEIWQANPQVENPHLIYPGDVLSLVYRDGRPIVTQSGFGPRIRREPLSDAVTTIPLAKVLPFLEQLRIFEAGEFEQLPYVLAPEENRLRATEGQVAYVRGLAAERGTRVVFLRATREYRDLLRHAEREGGRREVHSRDLQDAREFGNPPWYWQDLFDWRRDRHSELLGVEVLEVAQGEVLRAGDPATVLITMGDREIKQGDRVTTAPTSPFDLTFMPRAPDAVPEPMHVLAFTDAFNAVGPTQIVALSRGAREGVENGQVYALFQAGDVVHDPIAQPEGSFKRAFQRREGMVELPEEFVGHVMIFRTFDKLSYGLVMDGIRPARRGNVARAPVK